MYDGYITTNMINEMKRKNDFILHRVWVGFVLMLVAVLSVSAQGDTALRATDITRKERVAEMVPSLNLVTISTNKKSLDLGGLATIVRERAYGLQIGGLYNHVGDMGRGIAIAGLANVAMGSYYGAQIGGLWNYAGTGAKGMMIGGLGNMVNDGTDGLLLAGLTNIAKDVRGAQVAGLLNVARDVKGLQLAGLVNVAKTAKGVQLAGLLNVAEESDFPIALVNIVEQGTKGIALTYDALGNAIVAFRSGGRYTYGIVGVGYNPHTAGRVAGEAGYGIGIPVCQWLTINNEVKATTVVNSSMANFGYLLAPSVTLWEHCNLFGGPTINYIMSDPVEQEHLWPGDALWERKSSDGMQSALYIGYQVGLQYIF